MPYIETINLGLSYGARSILSSVNLCINATDRIGVTGRNGEGKTTLLRLIAGEVQPDTGQVIRASGVRIGYLAQKIPEFQGTVFSQAIAGRPEILSLRDKMRRLEILLEKGANEVIDEYSRVQNRFEALGGYDLEYETSLVLAGLGLPQEIWHEMSDHLSGGQKMRLALARILVAEPELLLLDEPTNHLDLKGVEWLESYLRKHKGAMLLVSHDRRFLDNLTTKTLEVENGQTTLYKGNFSHFLSQKEDATRRQEELYREQQELIERTRAFIQKWKANARRKGQAKSREKMLERLELVEKPRGRRNLKVNLGWEGSLGKEVLRLKHFSKTFESCASEPLILFQEFSGLIQKGERVALVGTNGCGKTTFLRCIQDLESYDGEVTWGQGVVWGYFSQETTFESPDETLLAEIKSMGLTEKEARDILGRFLFSGDDVLKKISDLSGGEKKRLALVKLVLSGANVLLLDEPTNHLDVPSREALEAAILDYPGTVILASHDRYFIDQVATRIFLFQGGVIKDVQGNYSSLLEEEEREKSSTESSVGEGLFRSRAPKGNKGSDRIPTRTNGMTNSAETHHSRDNAEEAAKKRLEDLENEILSLETREKEISGLLSKPETYQDKIKEPGGVSSLLNEYAEIRKKLERLYTQWDESADKISSS